jgi:hypothetical protein
MCRPLKIVLAKPDFWEKTVSNTNHVRDTTESVSTPILDSAEGFELKPMRSCDLKLRMSRSDHALPPVSAIYAEALPCLSSPPSPDLFCAVSAVDSGCGAIPPSLGFAPSDSSWNFADPCSKGRRILLGNVIVHE